MEKKKKKTNEEHGAGFEGTDDLLSKYLQDTPKSRITKWPDVLMSFEDWVESSSSLLDEGVRMGKSDVSNIKGNYTIGFEFEVSVKDGYEEVMNDDIDDTPSVDFDDWYNGFEYYEGYTWDSFKDNPPFGYPNEDIKSIREYFEMGDKVSFFIEALLNVEPKYGWNDEANQDILLKSDTYTEFETTQELIDYWKNSSTLTGHSINDFPLSSFDFVNLSINTKYGRQKLSELTFLGSRVIFGPFNSQEGKWFLESDFFESYQEFDLEQARLAFNYLMTETSIETETLFPITYIDNFVNSEFPSEKLKVVAEGTIGVDGEIITPPYPLKTGLKKLKRILDAIDDDPYLFTNEQTGLHATMGDWTKNEVESIDWLKFLVIYGTDNALKMFSRQTNHFTPSKINKIIQALEDNELLDLSDWNNSPSDFEEINNIVMNESDKFSAFNLSKLQGKGILEFRGFGNEDYEKRSDEIIFEIQKMIYAIEIASTPGLFRNEYLKGLYKLQRNLETPTSELISYYKIFTDLPKYILKEDAITIFIKVLKEVSFDSVTHHRIIQFFNNLDIRELRREILKDISSKKIVDTKRMNPSFGDQILEAITSPWTWEEIIPNEKVFKNIFDTRINKVLSSKGLQQLMKLYPPKGGLRKAIIRIRDKRIQDKMLK